MKIIKKFTNVLYSLSSRHQARQCRRTMGEKFLYKGHKYTVKKEITGMPDSYIRQLKSVFPNCSKLIELSQLEMYGSVYKKETIVLLSESLRNPKFAMIQKLYCVNGKSFGFVCLELKTLKLNNEVNAYEVAPLSTKVALDA